MTKVLIVDNQQVVIEGIKTILSKCEDLEVVGQALDGWEALRKVIALRPDVVIMDIPSTHSDAIELISRIKSLNSGIKIVVYTTQSDIESMGPLMEAGASRYVFKENPISDLNVAIEMVKRKTGRLDEEEKSHSFNPPTISSPKEKTCISSQLLELVKSSPFTSPNLHRQ